MRGAVRGLARLAVGVWMLAIVTALGAIGAARLTGQEIQVVRTGSMAPTAPTGALVVLEPVTGGDVALGDVISFRAPDGSTVMHRAVDEIAQDGQRFLVTKGDANDEADTRAVPEAQVTARMRAAVPGLGTAARALRPPGGLVLLVVAPLALSAIAGRVAPGGAPAGQTPTVPLPAGPSTPPRPRGRQPVPRLVALAVITNAVFEARSSRRRRHRVEHQQERTGR